MTGDNCAACKHIGYFEADTFYGPEPPGKGIAVRCLKGVWRLNVIEDTNDAFIPYLLSARECGMYEDK